MHAGFWSAVVQNASTLLNLTTTLLNPTSTILEYIAEALIIEHINFLMQHTSHQFGTPLRNSWAEAYACTLCRITAAIITGFHFHTYESF